MTVSVTLFSSDLVSARLTGERSEGLGHQVQLGPISEVRVHLYGTPDELRAAGERLLELATRAAAALSADDCVAVSA